jgi:hypothetical protein
VRPYAVIVIVGVATSLSADAVRERPTLELDGEPASLASRHPVPWERETVDLAFAVPKDGTVEAGRLLFDGAVVRSLAAATVARLNAPPAFEVGEPSVSPTEIGAGASVDATVRVDVTNVGDGRGTFGASLGSSYLSGSRTLTASLDAGAEREVTGSIPIGGDDAPTVRLDWGADEWTTTVPVVGPATATGSGTSRSTGRVVAGPNAFAPDDCRAHVVAVRARRPPADECPVERRRAGNRHGARAHGPEPR